MLGLEIKININKINFDDVFRIKPDTIQKILDLFKSTIENNIDTGTDNLGHSLRTLSPKTILRKGHGRPLFETGTLRNSIMSVMEGNNKGKIFIASVRDSIASILNDDKNLPFFNVDENERVLKQVDKILEEEK